MIKYITLITVAVALILNGCATKNVAYKTLRSTAVTVDAAIKVYFDGVVKGTYKSEGVSAVSAAYAKFQLIYNQAVKTAKNNPDAITPSDVADMAEIVLFTVTNNKH
jgi:hypothetical protein